MQVAQLAGRVVDDGPELAVTPLAWLALIPVPMAACDRVQHQAEDRKGCDDDDEYQHVSRLVRSYLLDGAHLLLMMLVQQAHMLTVMFACQPVEMNDS